MPREGAQEAALTASGLGGTHPAWPGERASGRYRQLYRYCRLTRNWPEAVQVVKRGIVERDENDELVARVLEPYNRPVLRDLDYWEAGDWHPVELRWPYRID